MLDLIQKEMIKESFRGFVGRQIFCAVGQCGAVLDCRRAVEVTITEGDEIKQVQIYCAKCFDKADIKGLVDNVLTPNGLTLESTDGRELYAKGGA
jgi:hypothetical protein|tara:strand:- start:816 stop:1100 length:285 start_codon:yes stop_codon:yes gene_type:complete